MPGLGMAAKLEKILMRMMLHLPMTDRDIIRSKGGAQALKTSRLLDDNGLEVIRRQAETASVHAMP